MATKDTIASFLSFIAFGGILLFPPESFGAQKKFYLDKNNHQNFIDFTKYRYQTLFTNDVIDNTLNLIEKKHYSYDFKEYSFENIYLTDSENHQILVESKKQNLIKESNISRELNLVSNKQYYIDENLFVAEGDVKVTLNNGILKADRIEFDLLKDTFFAKGNVTFSKGSQYFEASAFRYEIKNKYGEIENVYGILDVQYLGNDLNLFTLNTEENISNEAKDISNESEDMTLEDGYELKIGNISKQPNFITGVNKITGSINRWRVQSPLIKINSSGWTASRMSFSNDPFDPVETRIDAKDVRAFQDEENNGILISCSKSELTILGGLKIPTGKRMFGKEEESNWKFGIDTKDRDGIFISRTFNPIKLGKRYEIKLQPQFMIQRAVLGETNSYIANDSSRISKPILSNALFGDLFGMKVDLNGQTNDWNVDISTDISTFNFDRIHNGTRYSAQVSKDFNHPTFKDFDVNLFTSYRYKAWNGSLGRTDIYKAYGGFLRKAKNWSSSKSNNDLELRLGAGRYQAESFEDEDLSEELWRVSLFGVWKAKYQLWQGESVSLDKNNAYRFSPVPIHPQVNFKTNISTSLFNYSNGDNQFNIGLSAGPEFKFGTLSRQIFNYTSISIMPSLKLKSGESPFKFDNAVDLKSVGINYTQQLYGPLILNTSFDVNLDGDSSKYGEFYNTKYALLWQKRSYDFGLFYHPYMSAGGIVFRMNGFDFGSLGGGFDSDKF